METSNNNVDVDWDNITKILRESFFMDNDSDIIELCEELENCFDEEDGNQETLRNDLIEAVTKQTDHQFFFVKSLTDQFKFKFEQRIKLYKILLYKYIKLKELTKSNIINILKYDIQQLNYDKIISLQQFENILRNYKPDFNGNTFDAMNDSQFSNIFNKMNVSHTIWKQIYNTEMEKWGKKEKTKTNIKRHVHFAPIIEYNEDYKEEEEAQHGEYHNQDNEQEEEVYNNMAQRISPKLSSSDEKAEANGQPILKDVINSLIDDDTTDEDQDEDDDENEDKKSDLTSSDNDNYYSSQSSVESSGSSYSSDSDDSKESKSVESTFGGKIKRPKLQRKHHHMFHHKDPDYYPRYINKCVK